MQIILIIKGDFVDAADALHARDLWGGYLTPAFNNHPDYVRATFQGLLPEKLETIYQWFNEDTGDAAPYPIGALLWFSIKDQE